MLCGACPTTCPRRLPEASHSSPPFFHILEEQSEEKNLKQSKLSVPEGHCQIKIIANFANNKNAPADRRNAGPEAKRLILKTWPSGATNDY